jgi:uncharacterized membrane protein
VVAAAGAARLNTGHSDALAVGALVACMVMIVGTVIFAADLEKTLLAIIIYAAQLALLWGYSLRGNLVYGFDISNEYYDLHQTVLTGLWHTNHVGDAYGAMLSVTVMPAELHFLSGLSALMVFKVVYPAIGALFPVAIFFIARSILSRRWAFAAAAFFVVQANFAQELPGIARQEVALVLFAALIASMLDARMGRRSQWALVALLGLAMVLSHYSTTYVAVTITGLMLPLQWLTSFFRNIPRITGSIAVTFLVSLLGAVIWYGPVTHSTASGLRQLAQSLEGQGLNVLPDQSHGAGLISAYLSGNTETPIAAEQYARLVHNYYALNQPYIIPLRDAALSKYDLKDSSGPPTPPIKSGVAYTGLDLGSLLFQQLANILGGLGALLMVFRRTVPLIARQVGLVSLATLVFLVLIRVSGTLAAAYNQERALLQAMAILAIAICWCMQSLAGRAGARQATVIGVAVVSLAVSIISTGGLIGVLLGGGTDVNLANNGEDYERFYMTMPELASAQWLGKHFRSGQLVYADRYAQLPLVAMTGITHNLIGDVTPLTLNQQAWIYADRTNVVDKRGRALFDNHTVVYVFPERFIEANYNLVYANGFSEVFHR